MRLPGIGEHPVLYTLASAGVAYLIGVWVVPWLSLRGCDGRSTSLRPQGTGSRS